MFRFRGKTKIDVIRPLTEHYNFRIKKYVIRTFGEQITSAKHFGVKLLKG